MPGNLLIRSICLHLRMGKKQAVGKGSDAVIVSGKQTKSGPRHKEDLKTGQRSRSVTKDSGFEPQTRALTVSG